MNIFTYKAEIKRLQNRIAELEQIIEDEGYKIPEIKELVFVNPNPGNWMSSTHFNSIMNFMSEHNIEVVDYRYEDNGNFFINYRLPSNVKSVGFFYHANEDNSVCGKSTYQPTFKISYFDEEEQV